MLRKKKGMFCLFLSASLCFSLAYFGLPLFWFLFLCLSLSLSLLLFSFFVPSCRSLLLSFGSLFLSLSFLFFLLCFCFMQGTTSKYSITKLFINPLSLFWFPVLFSLSNPFFLSLFFLLLNYVLCSASMFWFQTNTLKHINFWSRGGLQRNGLALWACFAKCGTYRFSLTLSWQILVDVQKHYKIGYFRTFLKARIGKQMTILNVILWSKVGLLSGPSWCPPKTTWTR